jgi:hypothetical protein
LPATTTLYGTTQNGGTAGGGALFSCVLSNLTPFYSAANVTTTILHNFGDVAVANDGPIPLGGICLGADNNIYGTTIGGGIGSGSAYGLQVAQSSGIGIPLLANWTATGTIPAGLTFNSTTGLLSGTPLATDATGVYTITITPNSGLSVPESVSIKINQTYTNFSAALATTSFVNANFAMANVVAATPVMADGVPSLLKYLCDIDPTTPMTAADHAALPTLSLDTTSVPGSAYLALIYRQSAGEVGVGVVLETSDDLQTWARVPGADLLSQQVGTDATTGDPIVELGAKADGSPQQFVRLQVTPPTN